jgi:selenocysteine lyase/cysteine desulfurase
MLDRRKFLSTLAVSAAGIAVTRELLAQSPALPLPPASLFQQNEEAYWAELRRQFLIPEDTIYLNNGTVGASPRPVLQAVFDGYQHTEKMIDDPSEYYPIWGYGDWNEFRDPLAKFIGGTRDELALVRNATEANNFIANGVDMKAGEEVLISDQEHPSGEQPWNLKAKRYGIVVKKFALPLPPKSPAEILNRINDAITPKTRVLFVSHISTVTGLVLPVKEICALARTKGILSALDGAHAPGMLRFDVKDIGCDMYAASQHKWLLAPKGTGLLYVRDEVIDRIWSTVTTHGWDMPELRAERFQHIGSSNVPSLWGLRAAIELAEKIGMDRIERRQRQMADYIHGQMMARGAESLTSPDPALRGSIATVNVPGIRRMEMQEWMWKTHRIRIRGGEPSRLRLSTPYYLLKKDVDRFLEKFDEYRKQ